MNYSELKRKYQIIQNFINQLENEEIRILSSFLKNRIVSPESYVTMLGETSSGKSTLINGLINKKILKTSSSPTTGTVVEIVFDKKINHPTYYAINKNATMEIIDNALFEKLSSKPDKELSRLRVVVPCTDDFNGARIFDTPGYGSIIEEHENVLCDFIPNSDVIIYVIGYKVGIQENDFVFIRSIQELIHTDTEVIVVVNRCPATMKNNDRRLKEIQEYTKDLFHREVPIFTVEAKQNMTSESLVIAPNVWEHVKRILNTPEREQILISTLNGYLDDLLKQADSIVEKYEIANELSIKEKEELNALAQELRKKGNEIVNNEIIPTFDKIIGNVPRLLSKSRDDICMELQSSVEAEKNGRMDEMITYVNNHTLPMAIERETKQLERYIQLELNAMSSRVDDYLNEVIANYYLEVKLRLESNAGIAAKQGMGKLASKYLESGLKQYFAKFGGAGGSGAGVANAAKHLLKKTGDFFGKKFSRETYNALAHTLKKIGFTSFKTIGNVITVIIEVLLVAIEYSTWKSKLKKQIKKGLDTWYNSVSETIVKDLVSLKEQNIKTLTEIIEESAQVYEMDASTIVYNLKELINIKNDVHRQLEEENLC